MLGQNNLKLKALVGSSEPELAKDLNKKLSKTIINSEIIVKLVKYAYHVFK